MIAAKAWAKPLTEGVGRAKSYAAKLAVRHRIAAHLERARFSGIATKAQWTERLLENDNVKAADPGGAGKAA